MLQRLAESVRIATRILDYLQDVQVLDTGVDKAYRDATHGYFQVAGDPSGDVPHEQILKSTCHRFAQITADGVVRGTRALIRSYDESASEFDLRHVDGSAEFARRVDQARRTVNAPYPGEEPAGCFEDLLRELGDLVDITERIDSAHPPRKSSARRSSAHCDPPETTIESGASSTHDSSTESQRAPTQAVATEMDHLARVLGFTSTLVLGLQEDKALDPTAERMFLGGIQAYLSLIDRRREQPCTADDVQRVTTALVELAGMSVPRGTSTLLKHYEAYAEQHELETAPNYKDLFAAVTSARDTIDESNPAAFMQLSQFERVERQISAYLALREQLKLLVGAQPVLNRKARSASRDWKRKDLTIGVSIASALVALAGLILALKSCSSAERAGAQRQQSSTPGSSEQPAASSNSRSRK